MTQPGSEPRTPTLAYTGPKLVYKLRIQSKWYPFAIHKQENFKNPARKIQGCVSPFSTNLAGLPGPILAKRVKFGFTAGYPLNSLFGRLWHAKMGKRSKLLNPRAAAWIALPIHRDRLRAAAAATQRGLSQSVCTIAHSNNSKQLTKV